MDATLSLKTSSHSLRLWVQRRLYLKILSSLLFIILLFIGFHLAEHKPLWGDEVYSQHGIQKLSYAQILLGRIPEGNNSPLFYLIQKGVSDLAGYRLSPENWETKIADPKTRILLRLNPILAMALALTFVFYFFARHYGIWAGTYGFLTALFSYNLWLYWAEARPYALWFFLTTAQSLLFLNIVIEKEIDKINWQWLIAVHFLLAFTVIFSCVQIVVVSFLAGYLTTRDLKKYFWLTLLPCSITIVYYFLAPKFNFFFPKTATQLIFPCFPREWMALFGLYILFLISPFILKAKQNREVNGWQPIDIMGRTYLVFTILMLFSAAMLLGFFKAGAVPEGQGFEMSHRYFIYLTPVGILSTALIVIHFIKACKGHPWLVFNVAMGLWAFLIISFLRNSIWAISFF